MDALSSRTKQLRMWLWNTHKQTTFKPVVYAAISTETHQKMPNLGEILDEEMQATRAVESARNEPHKNEIKSDQQDR